MSRGARGADGRGKGGGEGEERERRPPTGMGRDVAWMGRVEMRREEEIDASKGG